MVEKIDVFVDQFSVSVLLRGVLDGFEWVCTGIYGPNVDQHGCFVGGVIQGACSMDHGLVIIWRLQHH